MSIPQLGKHAESILEGSSSSGKKLARLQAISKQAVAALCALGGFKETVKIGSEVQVRASRGPKGTPRSASGLPDSDTHERASKCGQS